MVVQCCLCKRVRNGKLWAEPLPEEIVEGDISHGYCPACAAKAFLEVEELLSARQIVIPNVTATLKAS